MLWSKILVKWIKQKTLSAAVSAVDRNHGEKSMNLAATELNNKPNLVDMIAGSVMTPLLGKTSQSTQQNTITARQ